MTLLERAMAAHRRGELADAEAGYRQVLAGADEADGVEAHQLLGVLLHRKGSHAEALEHLDRALALDAEHAGAHANRGLVLQALGRLSDAQQAFLDALGMTESGLERLIRAAYGLLDLITFFTAGPKEARAWTLRNGARAPEAAGVIHSDFERGFIRAETIAYADFDTLGGEAAAKEAGKLRKEGKDYQVQDGDVLHVRFNL